LATGGSFTDDYIEEKLDVLEAERISENVVPFPGPSQLSAGGDHRDEESSDEQEPDIVRRAVAVPPPRHFKKRWVSSGRPAVPPSVEMKTPPCGVLLELKEDRSVNEEPIGDRMTERLTKDMDNVFLVVANKHVLPVEESQNGPSFEPDRGFVTIPVSLKEANTDCGGKVMQVEKGVGSYDTEKEGEPAKELAAGKMPTRNQRPKMSLKEKLVLPNQETEKTAESKSAEKVNPEALDVKGLSPGRKEIANILAIYRATAGREAIGKKAADATETAERSAQGEGRNKKQSVEARLSSGDAINQGKFKVYNATVRLLKVPKHENFRVEIILAKKPHRGTGTRLKI